MSQRPGNALVVAAIDRDDGFYTAWCLVGDENEQAFKAMYRDFALRTLTIAEMVLVLEEQRFMRLN